MRFSLHCLSVHPPSGSLHLQNGGPTKEAIDETGLSDSDCSRVMSSIRRPGGV